MSYFKLKLLLLLGISLTFLLPLSVNAAVMEDYCVVPPYVKRDVDPNILVLMDNNIDMGEPAYGPEKLGDGVGNDNGRCETGEACADNYDPGTVYDGLFVQNLRYTYSGNDWVPDDVPNGLISGNLLNWATTSKYDLLQLILVGGKSRNRISYPNTLVSISTAWTKIYLGCVFEVNNANLIIKDETAGSCPYLDGTYMASNESESEIRVASADIDRSKGIIKRVFTSVIDLLIPSAYADKPLMIRGGPSSLPDGEVGQVPAYTVTLSASGGTEDGYTWNVVVVVAESLPPGLSLIGAGPNGSGELTVTIAGTPTLAGTYAFTIQVMDSNGDTDTKAYTIEITVPVAGVRTSGSLNVWVCRGNYTDNCNIGSAPPKAGIIDDFWDRARFGVQDFNEVAGVAVSNPPSGSNCIPASPKSSFLTSVENAVPIDPITPLVDGIYDAVDYYENPAPCADPWAGAEPCLKSFILMITGGVGADQNNDVAKVQDDPNCIPPDVSYNLSENTCYGFVNDLRPLLPGKQNVETFIVNTMGINDDILTEAVDVSGGKYYPAPDATQLRAQLIQAFQDMLKRAASGTAASMLASGEGQGANLVQAVFYPRTQTLLLGGKFDRQISWVGRLKNLWFHIDPFFTSSSIREDTTDDDLLDLTNDLITEMYFDVSIEQTMTKRWADTDGDGDKDGPPLPVDISFEATNSIWEAGTILWQRDVTPGSPTRDKRKIYTTIDGSTLLAGNFSGDAGFHHL